MAPPWDTEQPNLGFMLVSGDSDGDGVEIAGVHLAFYSERPAASGNGVERFCNLGAWCVLPERRLHGMRLLKALLAQPGYHFTDLSPSGNVVAINEKLGFEFLDTTTRLVPNLPIPPLPGGGSVVSDPAEIERALSGGELRRFLDHRDTAAARHLLLKLGDRQSYVIFRKDRRKRLPLFASILHVSDPGVFLGMVSAVSRHLLLRHGAACTLIEDRVLAGSGSPRLSFKLEIPRRKMFRSETLGPERIDYLYSELVCVPW